VETLAALIAREGKLNAPEAVGWVLRLAQRLETTHQQGLVHANVSAYCLIVESRAPLSRGVLIDAPRVAEAVYHSPERAAGGAQATSQADDAWALAVTLFYGLTGQFPFPGQTDAEVLKQIQGGPPRVMKFGFNDPMLQKIVDGVFARDLGRRVAQVTPLRQSLAQWVKDPKITSLPGLEDDDEDAPTMMIPNVSVGSLRQQAAAIEAPPAPSIPQVRPAAGMPAPPSASGSAVAQLVASSLAEAPAYPPSPGLDLGGYPVAPGSAPATPLDPRRSPTMMAVRPPGLQPVQGAPGAEAVVAPASEGPLSKGTVMALLGVWLFVTFGGAAVEYVILSR
jgi:serine/threonine protein kinase